MMEEHLSRGGGGASQLKMGQNTSHREKVQRKVMSCLVKVLKGHQFNKNQVTIKRGKGPGQ